MFKSKLISLYSTLSVAEKRRFKKWVNSPAHTVNPLISAFYDFLETRTAINERTVKRERVYAALFGKGDYDDLKIRHLMSEFLGVLEDFLAFETWGESPFEQWISLAKTYRKRQLPADAGAYLKKAGQSLRDQPLRDARFYLNQYRLQEEMLAQNPARDAALNLQEMANELAHFFVLELLRNACSAASHAAIYRADYRLPYLDSVLADCAAGRYNEVLFIRLYYHSYCCLSQSAADEHFFAYKNLLPGAAARLGASDFRDALLLGINYCIRRLHLDTPGFLREVFELYRLGLAHEAFLENGYLGRFSYKNIVAAALKLGETAWVETFLEKYTPLLDPAFRSHYERFCRAKLCYQRREYDQVQTLLYDLSFDDVFLELDARVLLLKLYFENAEWRLLEGFLTAFERFLGRKKMLAYHAPNYRNIVQFTDKLMRWKSGKRPCTVQEQEHLRLQIQTATPLTEREWLLQHC
jgi:hypothetical protein